MTTEAELLDRWHSEKADYEAWGNFVVETIVDGLSRSIETPHLFLRLPVVPRLKSDISLLQKALHRGKAYDNPYDDIEDKVGTRFVVLTSDEIPIIEELITGPGDQFWYWEKARDFVQERDSKPWEFGYQSVHYVVRAKAGIQIGKEKVPLDIPCEIQIRTLLQHAFSEVTHDTIYKPSVKSTPEMMRTAAKAMALIEATDDYFRQVGALIGESVREVKELVQALSQQYLETVGATAVVTQLDGELIDAYMPLISGRTIPEVLAWLNGKPYIGKRVANRVAEQALYRLPSILLIYFVVGNFPNIAVSPGVLTDEELKPIYSDLGLAMPD
ncbi:GTP pyrophosphokinase [Pseudorhizobium pelagicum]|uniref:RelA/SpoT domain-containing protein n=1 Tax=Pseudorhizobium pelagicum TaxID=1509405 RepID=A0A922NWU2_9HYPH|nr:RelA/SpoT domain-containing protein [Pseudorhizobium pelagicum]KEQ02516.1 hypothetical protein GV68_21775 [Pseudorhizobium pelagicum]KEQ02541.1 hypothetical protein GV67_19215 [Pseudorhizobium pelagicum]